MRQLTNKIISKIIFYRKIIVTLHDYISGLTGFDGEMKWYVSTRRFGIEA